MNYYLIEDMKRDVRIAFDENAVSGELLTDSDKDTLTLEEIIISRIPVAARIVETISPLPLLGGGEAFGESIGWESEPGYGMGFILLPDDFLRLVSFQMSDWDRAVSQTITESDPIYQMQQSRFGGVRGNPQKPVVAIVNQPAGMVLEFYSCTAGEDVYIKQGRYIPIPKIKDDMIELPPKIYDAVVYYTAYLCAKILNQQDAAAHLLETVGQLLQVQM